MFQTVHNAARICKQTQFGCVLPCFDDMVLKGVDDVVPHAILAMLPAQAQMLAGSSVLTFGMAAIRQFVAIRKKVLSQKGNAEAKC